MKVLNLQCAHQHDFEGWFGSEDDFQSQLARGLVECPLCGDRQITKQLSAPRLNLSTSRGEREVSTTTPAVATSPVTQTPAHDVTSLSPTQLQAAWLQAVQHVMANTEDVGQRFAEEARKMHYGESEERGIRGQATPEQTRDLLEEGISVMPLPMPDALKGPVQ
ncbi:MAG: DUF1178 family protein [Betaproteobacteria bacterium]|nr:DUF1178 family protein [Betaproteobacteria bacterium]